MSDLTIWVVVEDDRLENGYQPIAAFYTEDDAQAYADAAARRLVMPPISLSHYKGEEEG